MYENERSYAIPEKTTIYDKDLRYKDAETQRLMMQSNMERNEFEPKIRKRRTIDDQIEFNHQRLCELEKHIDAFRSHLEPVLVQSNPIVGSTLGALGAQEPVKEDNSVLMSKLVESSEKINWLIEVIRSIDSRLQV